MSGEDSGIEAVWEMVECEFQMERKSRRWKVKGGNVRSGRTGEIQP